MHVQQQKTDAGAEVVQIGPHEAAQNQLDERIPDNFGEVSIGFRRTHAGAEQRKQIGSTAVIALSHQGLHGVLAIASRDPAHYKSSVGTLFLTYIAEVLGRVLPRHTTTLRAVR